MTEEQQAPAFPPVALDFTTHWCPRHLLPLKKRWPKGAMLAMLGLFNAAVAHPDVIRACGGDFTGGVLADTRMLAGVLREFSPLCCLVGDVQVVIVIGEALEGRVYGMPRGDED